MRLSRGAAVALLAALTAAGPSLAQPRDAREPNAPRLAAVCPERSDPASFESTDRLLAANKVMSDFGARPTGSPAHVAYVDWLESQLRAIRGLQLSSLPYEIDRWVDGGASLSAGPTVTDQAPVAISGAVPYALPTESSGRVGRLVHVPAGTAITAQDVKGKVVIRDAVPGSVPYAAFRAVSWFEWDPDGTLAQDAAGTYERDFAGYNQRLLDLKDAATAGAAGVVFVHGFPRDQVRDQYAPYEGTHWKVPAVYIGVDEGEALKRVAAAGGSSRMTVNASNAKTTTRTLVATLPGVSAERFVIESHTDGMNAIWDNGPMGILALARFFAALPTECRARTLQIVFTTGHMYQHLEGGADRGGGAEVVAKRLDEDYDKGTVALIFALEHLGAREYAAVPRTGAPGRVLRPTGRNELNTLFVGETPLLIEAVVEEVVRHDIRRTFVLRGSDAPAATIPPHKSYGGEGTEYQQHLLPTIALVTGPWTLYNPAFGMEAIDGPLMREQTMLFADLILRLFDVDTKAMGGGYLGYRAARSLLCGSALVVLGLTRCPGDPYG